MHSYVTLGNDAPRGVPMERGEMLFAKHGFTSAAWDPPKASQSFETIGRVSSYSIAFQGNPDQLEIIPNYAGIARLEARYRAAGEIVLLNSGSHEFGFAVCTKCGYADSERNATGDGRVNLPGNFEWHASLFQTDENRTCWSNDEAPVLRRQHLSAKQVTHLLLFDLSPWLEIENADHRRIANTIAQCLRLAGCRLRQIDSREISVLGATASPTNPLGLAIVLYDSVSGGSGHVFEMMESLKQLWWQEAASFLDVPSGPDEVRRRAMMRSILTSDSPTRQGVPEFAPLEAQGLFNSLLNDTPWSLNTPPVSDSPEVPDIV